MNKLTHGGICFSEYSFSLREDFPGAGRVDVTHLGVRGRICTHGWSDEDAQVFCKSKEFYSGFAYLHSYEEVSIVRKLDTSHHSAFDTHKQSSFFIINVV